MDWKDVPVSFVKGRGKWIEVYHIRVGCETFQVFADRSQSVKLKTVSHFCKVQFARGAPSSSF